MLEIIKKIFVIVLTALFLLSTTGVFLIVHHCNARQKTFISFREQKDCCRPVVEMSCCSGLKKDINPENLPAFNAAKCCSSASLYKKLNTVFLAEKQTIVFVKYISIAGNFINTRILPMVHTMQLFNDKGPPFIYSSSEKIREISCLLL